MMPHCSLPWAQRILLAAAALSVTATFGGVEVAFSQETTAAPPAASTDASVPLFREPYVGVDEWRNQSVRHRYVHGGFKGNGAPFSIHFPPKEQYLGQFFQHITPTSGSVNEGTKGSGPENKVACAIASGAYFFETNGGGMASLGTDPILAAYRENAATARCSRILAAQTCGSHRTYGFPLAEAAEPADHRGFREYGGVAWSCTVRRRVACGDS